MDLDRVSVFAVGLFRMSVFHMGFGGVDLVALCCAMATMRLFAMPIVTMRPVRRMISSPAGTVAMGIMFGMVRRMRLFAMCLLGRGIMMGPFAVTARHHHGHHGRARRDRDLHDHDRRWP